MKARFLRNNIVGLDTVNERISKLEEIKYEVFDYFGSRIKEPSLRRPTLEGVSFTWLSVEESRGLKIHLVLEEIKEVIWSDEGDKSPSLDGHNFGFCKVC